MGTVTNINIECCVNKPFMSLNDKEITNIKEAIQYTLKKKTNLLNDKDFVSNCSLFNKKYYDGSSQLIDYDELLNNDYYNLKQKYYILNNEIRFKFTSLGPIFDNKLYDKYREILNYFNKYKINNSIFYDHDNDFIFTIDNLLPIFEQIKKHDNDIVNYLTYNLDNLKLDSKKIKVSDDIDMNFILHWQDY